MQLSLHADYACRTLIYLAISPRASIPQISKAYGISNNHLVKVVHRLGQAAEEIGLADVVREMEPSFDMVECFNRATNTCRIVPGCGLKHALQEATKAFLSTLEKYSLSDVIKDESYLRRALLGKASFPPRKTAAIPST